MFLFEQVYYLQ